MTVSSARGTLASLLVLIIILSLTACAPAAAAPLTAPTGDEAATQPPVIVATDTSGNEYQLTTPEAPTADPLVNTPPPAQPVKGLWISPELPEAFLAQLHLPANLPRAESREDSSLWIEFPPYLPNRDFDPVYAEQGRLTHWIYAAAAPFPTVTDDVDITALKAAWQGKSDPRLGSKALLVSAETQTALESIWGPASSAGVRVVDKTTLLVTAWNEGAFAIIPFEEIQPRWKILRVRTDPSAGQSPLDKHFDAAGYPLAVPIWIEGSMKDFMDNPPLPALPTNRDPNKLTVLTMTGVTALSRHIGERMESKGLTYPARDILPWLSEADLTHISNEVSFYQECPKPGPERADMRFCSHPKYIALLEAVGADIIELTGNHNLDWGVQPYLDSLEMYRQRGWGVYGGGANLSESQQPLLVEHNGNRLAFLGCSPAGPEKVWARADRAGSAPCNFERMERDIADLRLQGYQPVVTLQAVETDTYLPPPAQGTPQFRRLARAGAVIVSGSQSHIPQTMTLVGESFVHYGLGNLFFDQMEPEEMRNQFIDRHVFYNGKYLGVELLTARLEDYARPRPMHAREREAFLTIIFALSDWSGE